MKFTDRSISALKPREQRYEVWEDGRKGFGVRVSPEGRKSFIYLYRFQGKPRRMTLGTYPHLALADAHLKHAEAYKLLQQGVDPGDQEQAAKEQERRAPTVATLAGEYLERHAKPNKRSWREDERMLRKDVLPAWGERRAQDIGRRDVIALLDGVTDRGAPVAANRTLALLTKLFNFAVQRGILQASPCIQVKGAREIPRARVLSDDEVAKIWSRLDTTAMDRATAIALKLVLVTAQRPGEVAGAEWSEFDGEWWTIPGVRTKNRTEHRVPLTAMALELLREAKTLAGDSRYLFPSPISARPVGDGLIGDHAINERALPRAVKRNLAHFGVEPFVPHDLRRTVRTRLAEMGIDDVVAERVLNHTLQGITKVYNRYRYDAEKRQALEAWGRKLESIITGQAPNVVTIERAG